MYMKQHIQAALGEEFAQWEALLASLSEEQITSPLLPSTWTIKDNIAHLWAWQQRTIARVEAARFNHEPQFPNWPADLAPESEGSIDQLNDWLYKTNRDKSWSEVHQNWRDGFQRFLENAEGISERDLLDGDRYAWLNGLPLAVILLATYDHHQEHLEELIAWQHEHAA